MPQEPMPALHCAAMHGDVAAIDELVKLGANVNTKRTLEVSRAP